MKSDRTASFVTYDQLAGRAESAVPGTASIATYDQLAAFESAVAEKTAVAPPGWEDTVKKMKKHDEIDNPWALAWSMKNKGYTPGGKEASMSESSKKSSGPNAVTRVLDSFLKELHEKMFYEHANADPVDTAKMADAMFDAASDVYRRNRRKLEQAHYTELTASENFQDAVLARRVAKQFNTENARKKYLQKHPGADPKKHWVGDSKPKAEKTVHDKPRSRPKREKEYEAGRADNQVKKFEKYVADGKKDLANAKDDKERADIQHDLDVDTKNLAEAKAKAKGKPKAKPEAPESEDATSKHDREMEQDKKDEAQRAKDRE